MHSSGKTTSKLSSDAAVLFVLLKAAKGVVAQTPGITTTGRHPYQQVANYKVPAKREEIVS